jgi:hypothetical protein
MLGQDVFNGESHIGEHLIAQEIAEIGSALEPPF